MRKTGRPRASSKETLEEAATELFLEKGYPHTSIDDITTRAGVSRATFFNYFPSKADVLCVTIDRALDALDAALTDGAPLEQALQQVAVRAEPADIPLIVSQLDTMGLPADIDGVLPARLLRLKTLVARRIDDPITQWAVTGAIVEGALAWAKRPEQAGLDEALRLAVARLSAPLLQQTQPPVT